MLVVTVARRVQYLSLSLPFCPSYLNMNEICSSIWPPSLSTDASERNRWNGSLRLRIVAASINQSAVGFSSLSLSLSCFRLLLSHTVASRTCRMVRVAALGLFPMNFFLSPRRLLRIRMPGNGERRRINGPHQKCWRAIKQHESVAPPWRRDSFVLRCSWRFSHGTHSTRARLIC